MKLMELKMLYLSLILSLMVLTTTVMAAPCPSRDLRKTRDEPVTPTMQNILSGAQATASGQWSNQGPELTLDGNFASQSHWACEQLPATLKIELAQTQVIGSVRVWFYYSDQRVYKFMVESSVDGEEWQLLADWRENQRPATRAGFSLNLTEPREVRFLRFIVTDSSRRAAGAHIVEVQAFAAAHNEAEATLHGRHVPLARVDAQNVLGDTTQKKWQGTAWRNERVHAQFALWSWTGTEQLRLSCTPLRMANGAELPATAVTTRFVRHVWGDGQDYGDVLDPIARLDLPASGYRALWLSVKVPTDCTPGHYTGTLSVRGAKNQVVDFPLELEVLAARLPDPRDWTFYLDLWQHPWAVARYHKVQPFSAEHYALLKPIYQELASAGQKTLTISLTDLPWNHQNFDPYHAMIQRTQKADGSWEFDYTLFDEYVTFGKECGLGPHIHCYSMVTWGNRVNYTDASGDNLVVTRNAGTPEHEAYWGAFLRDFQAHLTSKGWEEQTFIALDERSPKELAAAVKVLRQYAPKLRIAMAGNRAPSSFEGIEIDVYSQDIGNVTPKLLGEVQSRRAAGQVTTFYICCSPSRPNTFTFSPSAEQVWLGYYGGANGFDGMLRWAFVNWPYDPLWDTSFSSWPAGDTFLLYPGVRASMRWELLRDGIEEAEKLKLLRQNKLIDDELAELLKQFTYQVATKQSAQELATLVEKTRQAVHAAARRLRP